MKIFKLMTIALVAMLGFSACDNDPEHIYDDHSADLVGTWTCLTENYAEALIINADGTAVSYGVENGEYWENVKGTVATEGGNITMTFEDDDNLTGHFDIIPGQAFSLFEDSGERYIYNYCKEDLSDEVIGMWVCNDGLAEEENDMVIMSYSTEGKVTMTTPASTFVPTDFVNQVFDYKVVGDLLFKVFPKENLTEGANPYLVSRLTYSLNGTSLGDVLIENQHTPTENGVMELTFSFLRVKQSLNLADKTYAYNTAYVTNAKGKDEDFAIMGHTFNIAKIKASDFNVMFGADLFLAEFPNSNTMKHRFHIDGQDAGFDASIAVEGNKVSIDMSVVNPALRKVDMYMFQDADDSQLHMYMPTASFINYFANMEVYALILEGKIDPADAAAIEKVFADMEARIESINVSFVFKALK